MRTKLILIACCLILLSACRASSPETPSPPDIITHTPTTTPVGTSTGLASADGVATVQVDSLATVYAQKTLTALAPTSTPGPTHTLGEPYATSTATASQTPTPGYPPTAAAGGCCGGGAGGGGGGAGGGGGGDPADAPYAGLEPSAGEEEAEGPVPTPDMMFFEDYGTNPFFNAATDNLSTFAVDVDTGSYTLTRRYLNEGLLPPPEAVRLEEFVNYFHQDYPIPNAEEVFNINLEAAPTPFNAADNYVLRVGIQGYQVDPEQRADANLVFVIDVSGSMDREERLEAVKLALFDLIDELRPEDEVGIVIYSTEAYVLLEPTAVQEAGKIKDAIAILRPLETTNVEAGLRLGYNMATENYDPASINRIILCSDGVANVGETDPHGILPLVREKAQDGITLTAVGFGLGNYNDVLMEQLADEGDGQYYYVDSYPEARRIFVEKLTSTLVTIARDVKVQVVFNPGTVAYYRLMGYENRDIPDIEFRDDSVDAGEINAGYNVTALYEIVPTDPNTQGEIATVHLRWADPASGEVREINQTIHVWGRADTFSEASARFQLNVAVVAFADLLGEGAWVQNVTWSALRNLADTLAGAFSNDPDVVEFADLVKWAMSLAH